MGLLFWYLPKNNGDFGMGCVLVKRLRIFIFSLPIILLHIICEAAPLPKYAILDLGTLGGNTSIAYGVNEQGAVAGKSDTTDGNMTAFYWDPVSGIVEIGWGEALGINDAGEVVGNIHKHTDDAFIWDAAGGLSFLNKGDFLFATANGISNSGKAVGYARKFNDIDGTKAILWDSQAGTLTEIGSLEDPGYAFAINGLGEVVGHSGNPSRAFLWSEPGGMVDLGTLNEAPWQYYARDINDGGQVAGYLKTDNREYKAFIWDDKTGMRLLPGDGESLAFAVNRHGHVVGAQGTMIGLEGKAYLWMDDQRIDLNHTLPSDSGWELREARDISDMGQICGTGRINGEIHAFLLTPLVSAIADIKANGSDAPITVSPADPVSITLELDPFLKQGVNADWWVAVNTPFEPPADWYSYVYPVGWSPRIHPCVQMPLFHLPTFEILNTTLPVGGYTFYFALDDPDGEATGPWWGIDAVYVNVRN